MYTETLPSTSTLEAHDPAYRKINFDDSPSVSTVSKHLRHAWMTLPASACSAGHFVDLPKAISDFIGADYRRTEEQRKATPKHPNKDAVRTEWRTAVAAFWNHVFTDVSHYLREENCNVGCFHAPKPEVIALQYPLPGEEVSTYQKMAFPENRLIIPAFLDPGVSVQAYIQEQESMLGGYEIPRHYEIGRLDGRNFTEAWYIRRDREVTFCVESDRQSGRSGVAAVFVCGLLRSDCPDHNPNPNSHPERMEVELGEDGMLAEEAIDEGYGDEIGHTEINEPQRIGRDEVMQIGDGVARWIEKDKWRPVFCW